MENLSFPLLTTFLLHFLSLIPPQSAFMLILCERCPWPVFPTVLCFSLPVLPKFEVIFEVPNQVYALDTTFLLRVCGR